MDVIDLDRLSEHAVWARYPGDVPTLDEAKAALTYARAVRRSVRKLLNVK
ncbi:MAG: HEPN domain-containing protein [Chloroflexota bacterium]